VPVNYAASTVDVFVIIMTHIRIKGPGSVVVKALCYKPEGREFQTRLGEWFSMYLILPAALDPGVYSASNRNEYQKQKKKIITFLE
jgi:hypothetical protein